MKICPQLFENFQVNLLTNREANTDLNTPSVNLRRDSRPRKQVNLMISGFISVTTRAGIQFDILLFIYIQIPSVVTSRQRSLNSRVHSSSVCCGLGLDYLKNETAVPWGKL